MSIEAMKQARDFISRLKFADAEPEPEIVMAVLDQALVAAQAAPAEAEKQEPHSWYSAEHDEWMTNKTRKEHEALNSYTHKVGGFDLPLYTTQPQREWVGLTDDERQAIYAKNKPFIGYMFDAIEAKLKTKNGFPQTEKNG